MRFSLRTLLIVLTLAPPLLAWLAYVVTSTWHLWPLMFALALLLMLPSALMLLMIEMGSILKWLFKKQIEEDKARISLEQQRREEARKVSRR